MNWQPHVHDTGTTTLGGVLLRVRKMSGNVMLPGKSSPCVLSQNIVIAELLHVG